MVITDKDCQLFWKEGTYANHLAGRLCPSRILAYGSDARAGRIAEDLPYSAHHPYFVMDKLRLCIRATQATAIDQLKNISQSQHSCHQSLINLGTFSALIG
jgi:hypothetical protein